MWNKIYTAALGIFVVLSAGLSYYAFTWLQSSTKPTDVVANYDYFSNINWIFLWISSLILLILANVLLWTTRSAWAMWATFLYFALFMLIQTFWLGESFFQYKQKSGLGEGGLSTGVFLGLVFCVLAAVIVFFNQFIVKRMRDKMYTQTPVAAENRTTSETALSEDDI